MPESDLLNQSDLRDMYNRLLQLNHEAFVRNEHDIAYHMLMAALQCAYKLGDPSGLEEVARLASQQLAWIDDHQPDYHHSTVSAEQRGHTSVYRLLVEQAHTRTKMLPPNERELNKSESS